MRLDLILQRVTSLGGDQKDLARKVFESLTSDGQRTFSTVESKLSKMLSGTNEGRIAFSRPPLRPALAASLGVSETQLADWMAADALLLDPAVSAVVLGSLRKQLASANLELIVVPMRSGVTARDALRCAADEREDAIVALVTEDDAAFYEGRERRFSVLKYRDRFGASLAAFPELVPPLTPDPPAAWGEHNEHEFPRVSHPELDVAIEHDSVELGEDRLRAFLKKLLSAQRSNNQVPSFSLGDVQPWLEQRSGTRFAFLTGDSWNDKPRYGLLKIVSDPAADNNTTDVWIHERRLHARGPGSAELAPWLHPHELVVSDAAIDAFRAALRNRNPFSDDVVKQLVADGRNVGLDLAPWFQKHVAMLSTEPPDTAVLAESEEQESVARDALRELCARPWHIAGPHPSRASFEKGASSTVPLWLRRALISPMILLAPGPWHLHVIASLGAGRVLTIRLSKFSGSAPTPLTLDRQLELDGGDVHVWMRTSYDEMLDGDSLVARRRRDERNQADDEYDD